MVHLGPSACVTKLAQNVRKAIFGVVVARCGEIRNSNWCEVNLNLVPAPSSEKSECCSMLLSAGKKGRGVAAKHKAKSSDDDNDDDDDNDFNENSIAASETRSVSTRQSNRVRPAKQRQVLHFSSDEEDDDFDIKPSAGQY